MSKYKVYKEKPCINCNGIGYHVWNDATPDCVICKGLGIDMEVVDLETALVDLIKSNDGTLFRELIEKGSF